MVNSNSSVAQNGVKRISIKHCEAFNEAGDILVSWPCRVKAEGYVVTRCLGNKKNEFWIEGSLNTKFIDRSVNSSKVSYKVEAYKKVVTISELDIDNLVGSLEQAQLKGNSNTLISDYIENNYNALLTFVEHLPHIDITSSAVILNDVWLSWMQKEQSGDGYSPERLSRGGNKMTVQQVVENTLKAYAKNQAYSKKYNNKDKNNGVEIELHSVSMLEEREEGSENNYITAQASLSLMKGNDSPLEDMIEICTLKEDLEYVLNHTKNFKVSAQSILDNMTDLLAMVNGVEGSGVIPGEDVIRTMNKTLFSEYKSSLDMIDTFDRIFLFMHKDITLFNQIYQEIRS